MRRQYRLRSEPTTVYQRRARTLRGADAKPIEASTVYSLQLMLSKFEYDGA